jgi:hypothetical protein
MTKLLMIRGHYTYLSEHDLINIPTVFNKPGVELGQRLDIRFNSQFTLAILNLCNAKSLYYFYDSKK